MEQVLKQASRFWFPVLCIIVSIILLITGFTGDVRTRQNDLALFGVLAILLIGIISLLYLLDIFKKPMVWGLSVLFLLGAIYFGYSNYDTINSELKYTEKKNLIKGKVIQRLKDVRTAELAYIDVHGKYTNDWNELKGFIKSGKIVSIKSIGALPDSVNTNQEAIDLGLFVSMPDGMTDDQAREAGLIVRDTIYDDAMVVLYSNKRAMDDRKYPLDLENFEFVPGTNNEVRFSLNAGDLDVAGGGTRPVFACEDPKPFAGKPLRVGSMDDAVTNGNWKE